MKIEIRYQSRGGNTRVMAEVIAESLGLKAEPIDKPLNEHVDLLFLGGGVYKWDADPQLIEYLKKIDSSKIDQIVPFSTTGGMKKAITRITEYAQKAKIKVNENQLCLKLMLQGHSMFGREGGHLNDKQVDEIKKFVSDVLRGY